MRKRPPAMLTKRLSATDLLEVTQWWRTLSPAERRGLRDGGRPPRGLIGRFVEPSVVDDEGPQSLDYDEYLVNHEISLEDGRTFHICSAHEQARSATSAGLIPAGFFCPRAEAECPMRVLLDQ